MKKRLAVFAVSLASVFALRLMLMETMPVFEPSEARYAAISANMCRTGDFLTPMFTYKGVYQPFEGKPPLVFQCAGAVCSIIGVNEFAVRLVPFVSFLILLALLGHAVGRLYGKASGFLAAGICATCVAAYGAAGMCMTDIPLTCCSAGALFMYACYRKCRSIGYSLAIGVLLGCGMLVKGPIAIALFALPIFADAAVNRGWRGILDMKLMWAVLPFIIIAAPWFVFMERAHPGFLKYFFINENLLRFLVHDYGDRYGAGRETFRGMAAVWMLVVTLPWCVVPLWELAHRRFGAFAKRDFFLCGALAITAFWCLTSRVPMAYLLPVVPLFSAWLGSWRCSRVLLWRSLPYAACIAGIVSAGALCAGLLFTDKMLGEASPKRISKKCFAYEFYHGPWGEGAPQ